MAGGANIQLILDEDLEYSQGSVRGSEMVIELRQSMFQGYIYMHTKMDVPEACDYYMSIGVNAVLSRSSGVVKMDPALSEAETKHTYLLAYELARAMRIRNRALEC